MLKSFQILGCSAGIPTEHRGTTCVMISTEKSDIMIDCGEGTYLRWKQAGFKWKNLKTIFISHMHPDHVAGLIPLLFYRNLLRIESKLTIFGPRELDDFLQSNLSFHRVHLKFDFGVNPIPEQNKIQLHDNINVFIAELEHVIPCYGFRFEDEEKSLVFVTDTRACAETIQLANNANVLIHEATYLTEHKQLAYNHFHTTTQQAFEIAKKTKVKRLILTHFSPRISDKDLKSLKFNGEKCVVFTRKVLL